MPEALIDNKPQTASAAQPKNKKFGIGISMAIFAFICFAAINFVFWKITREDKVSSDMWGGVGSIDLAVNNYKQLTEKPKVVLLGSSLMMYPFWSIDKETHPEIGDIFHHRFSLRTQEELAKAGINGQVYSFAIFGQMVSDAYIYVEEYLKGDKTPEYLVYGIAPRDFSDYDLPAPMATFTFKRLVGLSNFGQYASLYLPKFEDKIEFAVNHLCFFYNKRWRLQHEIDKAFSKVYAFFGMTPTETKTKSEDTAGFMLAGREDVRWQNSLNEYKRRYRNIENKDLSVQTGFLNEILSVCRQRNIKVVLVNLPLSEENRQLLPDGFYDHLSQQIGTIATNNQAQYLDLGKSAKFVRADFWDTTHLNHAGGKKLLAEIMPYLTRKPAGTSN